MSKIDELAIIAERAVLLAHLRNHVAMNVVEVAGLRKDLAEAEMVLNESVSRLMYELARR